MRTMFPFMYKRLIAYSFLAVFLFSGQLPKSRSI